jgi:glutamyl-tRNA synthetase
MGFPLFPLAWNDSEGYREAGYFPEAVVNFLALLGWNPGTEQELFSLEELVATFSLDRVHKSGARFDPEKTKWYNQHYLQQTADETLAVSFLPTVKKNTSDVTYANLDYVTKVVSLIKERAVFVSDFWELSDYFFVAPATYNEKAAKKQWKGDTAEIMNDLIAILNPITDFSSENVETVVKAWITVKELSFGKVMTPLRLFLVGDMKGPHIFDIMGMIGKKESISRIQVALERLGNH